MALPILHPIRVLRPLWLESSLPLWSNSSVFAASHSYVHALKAPETVYSIFLPLLRLAKSQFRCFERHFSPICSLFGVLLRDFEHPFWYAHCTQDESTELATCPGKTMRTISEKTSCKSVYAWATGGKYVKSWESQSGRKEQ